MKATETPAMAILPFRRISQRTTRVSVSEETMEILAAFATAK